MASFSTPTSPTLVQVSGEWCRPCKTMRPIATLAASEEGLKYQYVDIDEHHGLANVLEVKSVPTFLVYKDEKIVGRIVGSLPLERFQTRIKEILNG